jgi:trehalose/maltose hydrolase-like predicted phosphorylase
MNIANKYSIDGWEVIENGFNAERNMASESVFCLGNGYMCIRGFFEEGYPNEDTTRSTFIAGFYEELVNTYDIVRPKAPLTYKKIINTTDWSGIRLTLEGESFNMLESKIENYTRILNMKYGTLTRKFIWEDSKGRRTSIEVQRFVSMYNHKTASFKLIAKPLNYSGKLCINAALDANLDNKAFYSGKLPGSILHEEGKGISGKNGAYLATKTNVSQLSNATAMFVKICLNGSELNFDMNDIQKDKYINLSKEIDLKADDILVIEKYIGVSTSRECMADKIKDSAIKNAEEIFEMGYERALALHKCEWSRIWEHADVEIEGDPEAQQGIRFCLFQIFQSYSGKDDTVSIGCKGLTAEVYSGAYFWDSEVYALPAFMFLNPDAAKSLVKFRYNTLDRARVRAGQLGYNGAVYPWVTVNGTEDCNQWAYEGEIHINACIPWAIYYYSLVSGDEQYLVDFGAEVLIEESRFWADRASYSEYRGGYVYNCVCGPDEYQVAVDNNYYTNYMAKFTMEFTIETINLLKSKYPHNWCLLAEMIKFDENETSKWKDIIEKLILPYDEKRGVFIQDDQYLSRTEYDVKNVNLDELPIYKNWPWEKVMRHNIIKQADTLMLFHMLNDRFDYKTKKSNYDYYEPRTIHDSSGSGGIHSIIASELGYKEDAYKHYMRTARMDLDDYNTNTWEGLHITSFTNTWSSIVYGFAGMRYRNGKLYFNPYVPEKWETFSYRFTFRGRDVKVEVRKNKINITLIHGDEPLTVNVFGKDYIVAPKCLCEVLY